MSTLLSVQEAMDDEYVAICLAIKDQRLDLPEFLIHHYHHLGIRRCTQFRFFFGPSSSTSIILLPSYSSHKPTNSLSSLHHGRRFHSPNLPNGRLRYPPFCPHIHLPKPLYSHTTPVHRLLRNLPQKNTITIPGSPSPTQTNSSKSLLLTKLSGRSSKVRTPRQSQCFSRELRVPYFIQTPDSS